MEFSTNLIQEFAQANDIQAMDFVRLCNVSVTTGYKLLNGEPVKDLDTLYRVYTGLKAAGYEVTWVQLTGIE